jgi:hypothetical protein
MEELEPRRGDLSTLVAVQDLGCQWTEMLDKMWHATVSTLLGEPAIVFK